MPMIIVIANNIMKKRVNTDNGRIYSNEKQLCNVISVILVQNDSNGIAVFGGYNAYKADKYYHE